MNIPKMFNKFLIAVCLTMQSWVPVILCPPDAAAQSGDEISPTSDDLVFIHHSCGSNWLSNSLHNALLAKDYVDERNDVTYGTDLPPDSGRPDSLASTPGDQTNMNHWIRWFNDYLNGVRLHGASSGYNKIIMFKSCYPISDVSGDGAEPGSPFSSSQTIANYKAVYRHPSGSGSTYSDGGYTYRPLEDIFASNPDILFIPVTAPPLNYASTSDQNAHRARLFNNWLKTDWQDSYNAAHPGLNNVAVFDWFDILAYADDHASHPNRLKQEYGGTSGDSHPNATANAYSTALFATNPDNFIDSAWDGFNGSQAPAPPQRIQASSLVVKQNDTITFTVEIRELVSTVTMTNTVPAGLEYQSGSLSATAGTPDDSSDPTLRWTGVLAAGDIVTVTYRATVVTSDRTAITNQVQIEAPGQDMQSWETTLVVNGIHVSCPVILKGDSS